MKPKLSDQLKSLIGLPCSKSSLSYSGIIVIGMGDLIEYDDAKLRGRHYAQWEIRSYSASWRISRNGITLAGSYDYDGGDALEQSLQLIGGKILQSVMLKDQSADAAFSFEGGFSIELFEVSGDDPVWEMYGPESCWGVGPQGICREEALNTAEYFTSEERALSSHMERSNERWSSKTPGPHPAGRCADCV